MTKTEIIDLIVKSNIKNDIDEINRRKKLYGSLYGDPLLKRLEKALKLFE